MTYALTLIDGTIVETFRDHVTFEQAKDWADAYSKFKGPIGRSTIKYKVIKIDNKT
jgi:hypothetical protein